MKKTIFSIVFVLSLFSLKATHNRSGEITYKRIAPFSNASGPVYTYSITLITYTDHGVGIADRCTDTISFGDGQHAALNRVNGLATGCGCGNTGCGEIIASHSGSTGNYIVKKNVFSTIHTYAGVGSYVVSFFDLNRNANIVNISNSVNQPFYIESLIIITANTSYNSSPFPSNPPIDRSFVSSCYYHNPGAYDVDGDSLSYELIVCQTGSGQNVTGFTFPDAGTNGSFSIDTEGQLSWCHPQAVGEYNFAIKIKEWRKSACNGAYQMIGYVIRDMQAVIVAAFDPAVTPLPLTDTCIVAGTTLTKKFYAGAQTGVSEVHAYGSYVNDLPNDNIVLNQGPPAFSDFVWPTSCVHARKKPHHILLTYEVSGTQGQYTRVYRPFNVKIVPPAAQIYSVSTDTGQITINWHSPANCSGNISGYNVYRKAGTSNWTHGDCETGVPASSGFNLVFYTNANDSSFTDIYLQPYANGSNMNYIVTAVTNDCQESFAKNTQTVSVLVGIRQVPQDLVNVSVYPNPFNDGFEISTGQKTIPDLQATLYSSDGRMVYDKAYTAVNSAIAIRQADLKPGMYVLRLKTPGGSVYKKLVKE